MKTKISLESNGNAEICKIRNTSLYAILQDVATCEDLVGNCPNTFSLNINLKKTVPKKDGFEDEVYVTSVEMSVTFGSLAPKPVLFGAVFQDGMAAGYIDLGSMTPLTVQEIMNGILQPT